MRPRRVGAGVSPWTRTPSATSSRAFCSNLQQRERQRQRQREGEKLETGCNSTGSTVCEFHGSIESNTCDKRVERFVPTGQGIRFTFLVSWFSAWFLPALRRTAAKFLAWPSLPLRRASTNEPLLRAKLEILTCEFWLHSMGIPGRCSLRRLGLNTYQQGYGCRLVCTSLNVSGGKGFPMLETRIARIRWLGRKVSSVSVTRQVSNLILNYYRVHPCVQVGIFFLNILRICGLRMFWITLYSVIRVLWFPPTRVLLLRSPARVSPVFGPFGKLTFYLGAILRPFAP